MRVRIHIDLLEYLLPQPILDLPIPILCVSSVQPGHTRRIVVPIPKNSARGIREYYQRIYKPYRFIYGVLGKRVYIYLTADGQGDFRALIARRLLSA